VVRALFVLAVASGCTKATPAEQPPPVTQNDQQPRPPAVPDTRPRVILTGASGAAEVRVEVVATESLIEKGLMYRQYLAPDDGMLFLMGAEQDWRFWMRNTLIPLDILFITRDLTVAGILYDMKPRDTTSKGVDKPSLYVLEVNAGWAKAHGISPGAKVAFDGVTP
jgi:uncharacterized membrane protein (UPF0127 family)